MADDDRGLVSAGGGDRDQGSDDAGRNGAAGFAISGVGAETPWTIQASSTWALQAISASAGSTATRRPSASAMIVAVWRDRTAELA